ncbi:MAG: hypothetical protein RLZZ176_87 [Cyanobacteriota bacterium]|jgi:hypothetical protein
MPLMTKGERKKNIPKEVVSIWAESGWVLETPIEVKPAPVPSPNPVPEKTK